MVDAIWLSVFAWAPFSSMARATAKLRGDTVRLLPSSTPLNC